jgi:hypothetical protein
MLPDGGEAMDAELRLRYRISASVADAYVEAGYTAVVQDIIIGQHLTEYVKSLISRPVGVVVLAPRPEVVERREAGRDKTGYADGWTAAELDAALRVETPRIGLWLDTSDLTPEQTVTQILSRLPETMVG